MSTWDEKVRVNNTLVPKGKVLAYYKRMWNENPGFRAMLLKKGVFIRADYNGRSVIRRNVRFKGWKDVENAIRQHAIELHTPFKNMKYASYLDVDLPPIYVPNKTSIAKSIIKKLKKKRINISMVTDAPSGVHIFSMTPKTKLVKALKEIEAKDKRIFIGRSSKTKIVLDPSEANSSIPGSLSCKGKPYRVWKQ
jgi:hypothetical protein